MGTQRLRGLLESDRIAAEEQRPGAAPTALQTTEYIVPLRLRLKRLMREDRRVYVGSLIASASMLLVVFVAAFDVLASSGQSPAGASIPALMTQEPSHVRSAAPLVSHQPFVAPALEAPPPARVVGDRLQRARRVLRRTAGVQGAAQARILLEDLLRAEPKNGRAYAALAEACLRLEDADCAHTAVSKVVARQPRRASYRALAARVERTFKHEREGPAF